MTMPDRSESLRTEVQDMLSKARRDQILRLLRDIVKSDGNDDFNQTGTA
jgi:hypothetical protein